MRTQKDRPSPELWLALVGILAMAVAGVLTHHSQPPTSQTAQAALLPADESPNAVVSSPGSVPFVPADGRLHYFKDERSNLCFSVVNNARSYVQSTMKVPCSKKVRALMQQ